MSDMTINQMRRELVRGLKEKRDSLQKQLEEINRELAVLGGEPVTETPKKKRRRPKKRGPMPGNTLVSKIRATMIPNREYTYQKVAEKIGEEPVRVQKLLSAYVHAYPNEFEAVRTNDKTLYKRHKV